MVTMGSWVSPERKSCGHETLCLQHHVRQVIEHERASAESREGAALKYHAGLCCRKR